MPDVPSRRAKELRIREAIKKCRGERKDRLLELLGDPPDLDKVPEEFWDELRECERNSVLPILLGLYLAAAFRMQAFTSSAGVDPLDPDEITRRGDAWAQQRADELADGATRNTRKLLTKIIKARNEAAAKKKRDADAATGTAARDPFDRTGRKPIETTVEQDVEDALVGRKRLSNTGSTETSAANSAGEDEVLKDAKGKAAEVEILWVTERDLRVCFPAGTLVRTQSGDKPIEKITTLDRVLTRRGYEDVVATNVRNYSGQMTTILSDVGPVTSTSDHPVWSEQGWVNASDLCLGNRLDSFLQQEVYVRGVENFDGSSIPVYDIQVKNQPEFYANGVLVHNCPICRPLHLKPESVWGARFPSGPPSHPNCRCFTRVQVNGKITGAEI